MEVAAKMMQVTRGPVRAHNTNTPLSHNIQCISDSNFGNSLRVSLLVSRVNEVEDTSAAVLG